ncbi:hypothetical protein JCM19240_3330 [Vibrio maritimus]|uniref:Uncharacterized protein n=1 Tax=Vibrio maritimus TaxID=990268 RepID=A0A090T4S4_9VIBR|nr:hypothetical protein JCM19240_3330 [Vibrio maritimus]
MLSPKVSFDISLSGNTFVSTTAVIVSGLSLTPEFTEEDSIITS